MDTDKNAAKYLPLTEATYYILISLAEPLHGYGIMQNVAEISRGKVGLGPGTLYGALSKLEQSGLISKAADTAGDRRKEYILTEFGKRVAKLEYTRLKDLVECTEQIVARL